MAKFITMKIKMREFGVALEILLLIMWYLGPGTYTPMFAAQLEVGDTNATGAIKMYLGVENDEVQVIAHYFN